MTIVLLVEGSTETALKGKLKEFLDKRADAEGQPKVSLRTKEIMSLNRDRLRRRVELELSDPRTIDVVGLIDVYPDFESATKAKRFLREAVGNQPHFYPHAAQYDVEAWLLPYWDDICKRIEVKKNAPGINPERVNHEHPPSKRLIELYRLAQPRRKYTKPKEMSAILRGKDLTIAANVCPELKSFLNTLLRLGGLSELP